MATRQIPLRFDNRFILGLAAGAFTSSLLIGIFFFGRLKTGSDNVVFLRTIMPAAATHAEPGLYPLPHEMPIPANPDEDLVAMLMAPGEYPVPLELAPAAQNRPRERWQTVRMRVTGYCACPKCCGSFSDGITASNHRIRPGDTFVAADKFYGFGTEMIVPGYNSGRSVKVLDRGKAIKGNRLDLFFHSHGEAQKWGVKYLDVKVKVD